MFNLNRLRMSACAAALLFTGHAGATDIETILKRADAFRLPEASAQIETEVHSFKDGKLDKEGRYQVLIQRGGKSLVLFRSPGEIGQKVLMVGDQLWMLLPGSARPIRITPLQKLLGEAATGDIATMTWSDDYNGSVGREIEVDGVACLELELTARRPTLSYQRIVLHVARGDYRPVHADLYAVSNRKIKQAHFRFETRAGRLLATSMTLRDEIRVGHETVVETVSSRPRVFGDELFNPMFLNRSGATP
jgi:outer membrane lipoprotein-sorting protein